MNLHEHFPVALSDVFSPYLAFRPPKRISVSMSARQHLVIAQPGGVKGNWSADETPYMVEPMDTLSSRRHEAVVFVGPARTGKTAGLLLGGMAHAVKTDPGDMLMIQMTQDKAREFSKTDIDRALLHSDDLRAMKSGSKSDDNTHDKMFKHGMWLRIAWPTSSNVSGSTYRYVFITDLDRMENADNVDGEGPLFQLALKRTQTFLSRGMCLVESSPGRPIIDPNWIPATPHEAPPVGGIMGIYNMSDRRRHYWRCLDCHDPFEAAPGLKLFNLPPEDQLLEMVREANIPALAADYNHVVCPHCGSIIVPKWKRELNARGRWVPEGGVLLPDGTIGGTPVQSTIAGFWMGGVAAAYQSWKSIVTRYLMGLRDYALTGSEETLKSTTNVDQGMPYLSMHLREAQARARAPEERKSKALERYVVPEWTRYLVASVDVQGGTKARFEVQVHAHGTHREQALVDRFPIKLSKREGMGDECAPIDPGAYAEDWDVLTEKVVKATYRTPIEGKELRIKLTVVDSGGEDGVTHNAYAWYRRLRQMGLHSRVRLYKGASTKQAPLIKESWVGARNKEDKPDIPLLVCNPNLLADIVDAGLKREGPGPGYIHFPDWLPKAFFDELQAEVRNPDGTWTQVKTRNESFDLCKMIAAGNLVLGVDKVKDWAKVVWAAPLESNPELVAVELRREEQREVKIVTPVAVRQRPQRRSAHSPYLT